MSQIQMVNQKTASDIIRNKFPEGMFYSFDQIGLCTVYKGIEVTGAKAESELFNTLKDCKKWLRRREAEKKNQRE